MDIEKLHLLSLIPHSFNPNLPGGAAADTGAPPDAAYFAAASAAMTSSLPEMVDRKGSATVSAASWASWFTEAQQSPTTTTL